MAPKRHRVKVPKNTEVSPFLVGSRAHTVPQALVSEPGVTFSG